MPEKLDLPPGQGVTLKELSKKHLVKRLGDYLKKSLNVQERHLLMLHFNDGLPLTDIARVLNVSTDYAVRLYEELMKRIKTDLLMENPDCFLADDDDDTSENR